MSMRNITLKQKEIIDFWKNVEIGNNADHSAVVPKGWRAERHLSYIQDYHVDHMLNLYYPEDFSWNTKGSIDDAPTGLLPTIINIHGGGWMYGHVDDSENYMADLAAEGYAVMGMGYRLVPETDAKGMVQDIYESLHWLEHHGKSRGFDLSRVLVTGDSAGGHLSLLVACIQKSPELQKLYDVTPVSFEITAVGISCPAVELDTLVLLGGDSEEEAHQFTVEYKNLMLGNPDEMPDWGRAISFSEFVRFVPDIASLPPVFLIGSENEALYEQTKMLLAQFDELGIEHDSIVWKKKDGAHLMHVFNVARTEWLESRISRDKMLRFFNDLS